MPANPSPIIVANVNDAVGVRNRTIAHINTPATGARALPKIENANDFMADNDVQLPKQIINGVLHKGLKGIVGGASKSKKTWTLLEIAIAVATGTKWLGFDTVKSPVLYVNLEIPRPFLRERIKVLSEKKRLADIGNLNVWNLRGEIAELQILVAEIIAAAKKTPYDLVIVDPVYKVLGGMDENAAGDIATLCNQLDLICTQTGAALLYAAHYSKGNQAGKQAMDRISGSGVFSRDADSLINFTSHAVDGAYTVEMILRNLPEQEPFVVEWKYPVMVERRDLDPADLKQRNQKQGRGVTPDEILDLVPAGKLPAILRKDLIEQCREANIGENRAVGLIKTLLEQNKIFKWSLPRQGIRPAIAYHRNPPPAVAGKLL